jgi:hypothetical protein
MTDRGWMEQAKLLDCNGRVSHTLTLLFDGMVEVHIASSGVHAIVDPVRRTCLTPGVHLHRELLDAAGALRPS